MVVLVHNVHGSHAWHARPLAHLSERWHTLARSDFRNFANQKVKLALEDLCEVMVERFHFLPIHKWGMSAVSPDDG